MEFLIWFHGNQWRVNNFTQNMAYFGSPQYDYTGIYNFLLPFLYIFSYIVISIKGWVSVIWGLRCINHLSSFPGIPMWLGIQHKMMVFWWSSISTLCSFKKSINNESRKSQPCSISYAESEPEEMTNLSFWDFEICSKPITKPSIQQRMWLPHLEASMRKSLNWSKLQHCITSLVS